MPSYTTAQLDTIVSGLENALGAGFAEVTLPDGRVLRYPTTTEIRSAISYFKALYDNATDAPPTPTKKVRTFYVFGGKGIGF